MTSQFLDRSGMVGGTGGPGAAGSMGQTGGPGVQAGMGIVEPLLNNPNQTIEQFALEVAYQGLVGATGGGGGIPSTVKEAQQVGVTMASMRLQLSEKVNAMENATEIITELRVRHSEFNIVLGKANSQVAYCAFRMGFYLLRLQGLRMQLNKRDWVDWAAKHVDFISKRSREKYMNIASLPAVESHFAYGVELLSEIGSYYSSLSEDDAELLGPDPTATLLKSKKFAPDAQHEDRKALLEAVIQVKKLERQKVCVDVDVMERFLKDHKPLTSEERKFLKELAELDKGAPQRHMEQFISEKIERKNFIPDPDQPVAFSEAVGASQGGSDDDGGSKKPKIPNIDMQVATLDESFDRYLSEDAEIPGSVDVEALERLASKALELVKKVKGTQQGNPQ